MQTMSSNKFSRLKLLLLLSHKARLQIHLDAVECCTMPRSQRQVNKLKRRLNRVPHCKITWMRDCFLMQTQRTAFWKWNYNEIWNVFYLPTVEVWCCLGSSPQRWEFANISCCCRLNPSLRGELSNFLPKCLLRSLFMISSLPLAFSRPQLD